MEAKYTAAVDRIKRTIFKLNQESQWLAHDLEDIEKQQLKPEAKSGRSSSLLKATKSPF